MSRPRPKMGLVIPDEQIQSYKVEADGRFVHGDITIDNSGMKIEEPVKEETHKNELKSVEELDVLEKLGEGNSSVVHRAYDKSTGKMIALKRINIYDRARRHQILKELHTLYRSECPFIISFYGAFFKDGAISIALEYMDAGSLSDVLSVMKRIPEKELAYFAKQLTAGLAYLRKRHQVHRDIKPSNICFNTKGEAKWSDFGITSQLESSMEGCDSFVGTYPYMSPERIMGSKYSYPSDVWSLGLVLLECAIGRFPYPISSVAIDMMQNVVSGPTPTVPKDAGFSAEFENFIECCLNKDPEKRSTAKDLLSHPWLKLASKISADDVSKWVKNAVEESKKAQQQRDEQGLFATGTSGTSTSGTGTQPFSSNSRLVSGGSSASDLNPFLSSLSLSAPNITPSNNSSPSPKSSPSS